MERGRTRAVSSAITCHHLLGVGSNGGSRKHQRWDMGICDQSKSSFTVAISAFWARFWAGGAMDGWTRGWT